MRRNAEIGLGFVGAAIAAVGACTDDARVLQTAADSELPSDPGTPAGVDAAGATGAEPSATTAGTGGLGNGDTAGRAGTGGGAGDDGEPGMGGDAGEAGQAGMGGGEEDAGTPGDGGAGGTGGLPVITLAPRSNPAGSMVLLSGSSVTPEELTSIQVGGIALDLNDPNAVQWPEDRIAHPGRVAIRIPDLGVGAANVDVTTGDVLAELEPLEVLETFPPGPWPPADYYFSTEPISRTIPILTVRPPAEQPVGGPFFRYVFRDAQTNDAEVQRQCSAEFSGSECHCVQQVDCPAPDAGVDFGDAVHCCPDDAEPPALTPCSRFFGEWDIAQNTIELRVERPSGAVQYRGAASTADGFFRPDEGIEAYDLVLHDDEGRQLIIHSGVAPDTACETPDAGAP